MANLQQRCNKDSRRLRRRGRILAYLGLLSLATVAASGRIEAQGVKISALPDAASAGLTDMIPCVQGDTTRRCTPAEFLALLAGGVGIGISSQTISTASNEADFLISGALTCGASTQGKVQVHSTTPLQYCDNAGTPTLRYAAYGNATGECINAADNSVALGTDTTGNYAASSSEGGAASSVAANSVTLTTDTVGNYAAGDGEAGNATGVACTTCVDATDIADDAITEAKLKMVNAPTDELCLSYESTTGDFEWQACGSGVSDHGALTGLSDDDHTQYALLLGRSGGQTLIGGTGALDALVLDGSAGTAGTLTVHPGGGITANGAGSFGGGVTTLLAGFLSTLGGDEKAQLEQDLKLSSDSVIRWYNNVDIGSGSVHVGLAPGATGELKVTNGSTGSGDLLLDEEQELRFAEANANGDNYLAFRAPATVTTTSTCTLEDDSSMVPDSCVGDGTDDDLPDADEVVESMLKAVDSATDEECLTFETTTGDFEWQACGAGGAVGGSDTQVLFNDAGTEAGDAGLTYNKTTDKLTVAGVAQVAGGTSSAPGLGVGSATRGVFYESGIGPALTAPSGEYVRFWVNGAARWHIHNSTFNIVNANGSSGTAVIQYDIGSSTVPPYSFTGDLNTGLGWGGADDLRSIAGGVSAQGYTATKVTTYVGAILTAQTLTIADNGTGTAATGTLAFTKSLAKCDCGDANGCDVTLSETGMADGWQWTVVNISANPCNFADTSGVSELPAGGVALGQWDSLSGYYVTDRFVLTSTSNN